MGNRLEVLETLCGLEVCAAQGLQRSSGVITDPPRCQARLSLKCQQLIRHLAKFICHLGSYVLNISLEIDFICLLAFCLDKFLTCWEVDIIAPRTAK